MKGKPETLTKKPKRVFSKSRAQKAMIEKGKDKKRLEALERCRKAGVFV